MLKTSQIVSVTQKLSPQLIQSQLLLAVPTLVLENEIKTQLESNPLLEESTEIDETTDETNEENINEEIKAETPEIEKDGEEIVNDEETYDLEDWYDYSDLGTEGYKSPDSYQSKSGSENRTDYEVLTEIRLRETPLDQLHRTGLDEKDVIIGEEIIGSLDEDGYLRDLPEDIISDIKKQHDLDVTTEDFDKVLKVIQKFDPVGIASRNIQECLTVQLEEMEIDEVDRQLCINIINDYFEDFRLKRYEKLSKNLGVSLDKINEIFEIIHKLNPVPGNLDNIPERNYIYPDYILKKLDGDFVIELNDDFVPSLRINRKYLKLAKQKNASKQTKEFVKNKLDAAKWFMNSIISRRQTMMKVMKAILDRQREFFETNGTNLKPMFEKDIAADINMDISTVSRTVRNKYVQTDFGTFELRYFFSNSIQTDSGEDVSTKIVKEKIKGFIDNEDKAKPLSDDKITRMINDEGYSIARRTVAKYREAMKIPKATLRRKIMVHS